MTSYIGLVGEFEVDKEDVEAYIERYEQFLLANDITDDGKKKAIFLASLGANSYKLLRTLADNNPAGKSYNDLKKLLKNHLKPKPNVISTRYKFFKRDRHAGESVSAYIAVLRELSERCEFQANLEEQIRDRFVCGINDRRILQKLLSTEPLTMETALQHALAIESAMKDAKLILGAVHSPEAQVNYVGKTKCYRCGNPAHLADKCQYKEKICYLCKKAGHFKRDCPEKKSDAKVQKKNCNKLSTDGDQSGSDGNDEYLELSALSLYMLSGEGKEPILVDVCLNGVGLKMEVDTGAAVSVVSKEMYEQLKGVTVTPTKLRLRTYTGERVAPVGVGKVKVELNGQVDDMPVMVVAGKAPALIGRDWLQKFKLDWNRLFPVAVGSQVTVNKLDVEAEVETLKKDFPEVFTDSLGCFNGFKVKIPVVEGATPKYFKPRRVPYALIARVEDELDKLEKQGVWEKVQYSEWAAPIVTVLKDPRDPAGPIRICGDYKLTVNKVAPLDNYPVPSVTDQLATLNGGVVFSKLDLSQAYQQLPLEEGTRELLTISTHRGLYRPFRLQFGVHSAAGIFQRVMEQTLAGIEDVKVRVDDILIGGRTIWEHIRILRKVLERLRKAGFTVKWGKCSFLKPEVVYCGHLVSGDGIRPLLSNVEAILKAPTPKNVTEVKSFLGMVNYYNMFIEDLATVTEPLHALLRKGVVWEWSDACRKAFNVLKKILSSAPVLTHFDPKKEIYVQCDASPYGLGAVLAHVMDDGTEKPVSYSSRTMTPAERNYAQVEREGLSVVFGVKKFHQYLYGQKFVIFTDHKPLLGLFGEEKGLPDQGSQRVLRWALLLSAYHYYLVYKKGVEHGNADALSRLPIQAKPVDESSMVRSVRLLEVESCPVSEEEVKTATRRDPILSKVLNTVLTGWGEVTDPDLRDFKVHANELCVEGNCVLWGSRVIIPKILQNRVLKLLHEMHPGTSRMKALARSYVWWPGMDKDVESMVRNCRICEENQRKPAGAPIHPWEHPGRPWQRLHVDHAGPLKGNMYLLIVDAYSRWLEVLRVSTTSSQDTLTKFRSVFATHGLPESIVSDNGPSFTSTEYKEYLKVNGIADVKTAPYHPSSNGQVERYVQTFKRALKKAFEEDGDTKRNIDRLLFSYRTTPHTASMQTPAELLMNRKLRTRLDMLKPTCEAQRKMKCSPTPGKLREFHEGDAVLAQNFGKYGGQWLAGVVSRRMGATNYEVRLSDGQLIHRHVDQMIASTGKVGLDMELPLIETQLENCPRESVVTSVPAAVEDSQVGELVQPAVPVVHPTVEVVQPAVEAVSPSVPRDPPPRRSTRSKVAPAYLGDYVTK